MWQVPFIRVSVGLLFTQVLLFIWLLFFFWLSTFPKFLCNLCFGPALQASFWFPLAWDCSMFSILLRSVFTSLSSWTSDLNCLLLWVFLYASLSPLFFSYFIFLGSFAVWKSIKAVLALLNTKSKNLPAMWETWVHSLGWEDPLEEGMATHCGILENPHGQRSLVGYSPWVKKSQTGLKWLSMQGLITEWSDYDSTLSCFGLWPVFSAKCKPAILPG